ncbi:hypothetical protein [Shinella sp.]|uniref:hypothetical protein n=1 Tax=Shinella sp. TaxID=1870904 RepID=UPI003F71FE96
MTITFLEAYALHGPDVERIAFSMGIKPHEADRLINAELDRQDAERAAARPRPKMLAKISYAGRERFQLPEWHR